jgi:hypothetical protein
MIENLQVKMKLWALILKYLGFAVFAICLGLIILFSILQIFFASELLTDGLLVGVALIIMAVIMEKVA